MIAVSQSVLVGHMLTLLETISTRGRKDPGQRKSVLMAVSTQKKVWRGLMYNARLGKI